MPLVLRVFARFGAGRGPERQFLGQGRPVLGDVGDARDRRDGAKRAGVGQVACFAAEEGEAEVADRGVGDDRNRRLQTAFDGLRVGPWDQVHLAIELSSTLGS